MSAPTSCELLLRSSWTEGSDTNETPSTSRALAGLLSSCASTESICRPSASSCARIKTVTETLAGSTLNRTSDGSMPSSMAMRFRKLAASKSSTEPDASMLSASSQRSAPSSGSVGAAL
eukprot:6172849-Pleurochrysis_carterae.AAC.4